MDKETKKNGSKKVLIVATITLIVGLGSGYLIGQERGREMPATNRHYSDNNVIATVGDVKIKEKELKQRMEPMFYMNGKTKLEDEQIDYYEQNMIDYITTTEVLYQEGVKKKMKVEKEELVSQYEALMTSITQTFQMDEEAFLKKFKLTKEEVEKSLEKEIIAAKFIEEDSKISDKEVDEYYKKNKEDFKQVQASHILIQTVDENGEELTDDKKKEAKKTAEDVLNKALEGEDFAELAKKYSEDTSAQSGGDLGFFGKGQMVAEFEKAAFDLNKGEISPKLIETQYGYHIIKKIDEKTQSLDEIKSSLKEELTVEKQNSIIDKLMKEYKVEAK
ncbi:MAG: peptidylprolyl isomerase [Paraclostridium sp.]